MQVNMAAQLLARHPERICICQLGQHADHLHLILLVSPDTPLQVKDPHF